MDIYRHSSPKDLEGTVMKRTYNNITFLDPSLYLDYYAGPLEIFMATRIDVWFLFAESFDHENIHSTDNEDVVLQSDLEKLSTEMEKDEERISELAQQSEISHHDEVNKYMNVLEHVKCVFRLY